MNRLSMITLAAGFCSLVLTASTHTFAQASPASDPVCSAYLMAYFGPQEKLFYAYSRDARHWTALNDGQPVFDPGPDIRLRDPFLNRVDRTFHLVHTKAWDTPIIYHWRSTDLLHWEGGPITVVRPEQKRAWAPEFFFSKPEGIFHVFWASEINGHNAIFHTSTHDWTDLSPERSAVYYDLGRDDIDFTVTEHGGTFYAFHKPGTVEDMLGNALSTSPTLDPTARDFGFGRDGIGREVLPDATKPIEGPEIVQVIGQDRWYVYGDPFHAPMEAWETTDFATFHKVEVSTPPGAKHCGMIPITESELNRLLTAYPTVNETR